MLEKLQSFFVKGISVGISGMGPKSFLLLIHERLWIRYEISPIPKQFEIAVEAKVFFMKVLWWTLFIKLNVIFRLVWAGWAAVYSTFYKYFALISFKWVHSWTKKLMQVWQSCTEFTKMLCSNCIMNLDQNLV